MHSSSNAERRDRKFGEAVALELGHEPVRLRPDVQCVVEADEVAAVVTGGGPGALLQRGDRVGHQRPQRPPRPRPSPHQAGTSARS